MYKNIVCKTMIGMGKLSLIRKLDVQVEAELSKTLGCWIINLVSEAYNTSKEIKIKGSFDIELWYAVDKNQKSQIYREKVAFDELASMTFQEVETINDEVFLKTIVTNYPVAYKMVSEGNNVHIEIQSEFLVNAFAEAILAVQVADDNEADLSLEEEILMNVNPNYLTSKD